LSSVCFFSGTAPPAVGDVEGHYTIDKQHKVINWQLPIIDQSSKSGVLEFSVNSEDVSGFFPIKVSFVSNQSLCNVETANVLSVSGAPIPFSQETTLTPEEYVIV
jgi:hypothetical protein